jgi:hypothetical protein
LRNRKDELTKAFNDIYINNYLGNKNKGSDKTQSLSWWGCKAPEKGWNNISNEGKFRRIVKFFELTFGYSLVKAIKEATTFHESVHSHLNINPLVITFKETDFHAIYIANKELIQKFLEDVWKICSSTRGVRKTKKKRKKNVSPIKTRKVKKQKK